MKEKIILGCCSIAICTAIYVVLKGRKFLEAKLEELKANKELAINERSKKAADMVITIIDDITKGVVYKLEQTTAKDLREKVKAGLEDRQKLVALADEAYREVLEIASKSVLKALAVFVEDTESYIRNLVEKNVLELKEKS